MSRVFLPVGALRASWSKVIISPPALRILSRAFSVTCRAQTVILGTSKILRSLVMVPTQTTILSALPVCLTFLTTLAMDRGGRLIFDIKSLFRMILLNLASVCLTFLTTLAMDRGGRLIFDIKKPLQDDLVELSFSPSGQKPVKFDEEPQVDILRLRSNPPGLPVLVVTDIDTHLFSCRSESSNISLVVHL